ncbi:pyrroloquinoline quinone biosynthesis protein PqqE [Azospirillum sp. CT11-132]|jgi:pyrroloquinoline quinone biosynthesis protein E|uniref:pyrroloquinoline quinone biosynthesis protein PqqE n=1 Tax=unclassified Azospirillum TaxID=2630922 RepID=UPI000D60C173|nr:MULTISPECIES: pyrroloquinoline quinone biosynthesis protein PqqE [unclassified Azospirillum]PWC55967.1 pyrroloquinoline quinone biosynthesis protein PqqE [Azospirillum sp. TSH7]PWC68135.1 pyrroloquinoline quinone biosynthesis protein PqqE [Azospirillum sp. TSH20]QCG95651.1 pyrroloquinoline quinone biosynthesis protein PqqE [Azospirillum sp. TSA2s]
MSCALPAFAAASNAEPAPPFAVLMELTHRCPLRCPYCSNPVALDPASAELDTATWKRVLDEAADVGALQVHFSGGEPCVRKDLEELVAHATEIGLYSNLITSAVLLDQPRLERLQQAGLQHVQISLQDSEAIGADRVGGFKGGHAKKLEVARAVVRQGLALTINAVLHRHNIDRVNDVIDLAMDLGAGRIEIANVQYYGWALANRAALMPSRDQLLAMDAAVRARLPELAGRIVVDYVVPDYYARRPKSCMGGWARRFMNVNPRGRVLPCHAAETIPGMEFETVHDRSLSDIWRDGPAFTRYRGTDWMPEPCQSCDHKEEDWGGCRCQALALAGSADATDPVCELSPAHADVAVLRDRDAAALGTEWTYRGA